ncbi:MAG: hypothetical protein A2Z71_01570 [Chloroflexi bacterium RBG_13_50_21]|nr:MAG: hypothetical protein A2Z71_01570 [Chloroflexi bacterium RBG_13_50_21]
MKKILLIGLIVAFVLIVVGGAGIVYARVRGIDNNAVGIVNVTQNRDKIVQSFGYGPGGMMGGDEFGYGPGGMMGNDEFGYGPGGMMGGDEYGYGPGGMMGGRGIGRGGMMGGRGIVRGAGIMHDTMISAFANAVGLTVDEVNTRLSNGETLKEIAIAQGTAEADLPALATQVRQAAMDQAVADGVITQAQADLMLEHMNTSDGKGFGFGIGSGDCPMWDDDEAPQP